MSRRWSCNSVSIWRTSCEPAGVWVRRLSMSTGAMRPRVRDRATAARTWAQKISAVRPGARGPSNQPPTLSDEAEAIDLVVGAGGLDQPLPATAFPAPDPRERGMKRILDLILEIEIGVRQEGQQFFLIVVAREHLVPHPLLILGYSRFNFVRASSILNCQSTPRCLALVLSAQIPISDWSKGSSPMRRSVRH